MKKSVIILQVGGFAFRAVVQAIAEAKFREDSVIAVLNDPLATVNSVDPEEEQLLILDAIPNYEHEAFEVVSAAREKSPRVRVAIFTADLEHIAPGFLAQADEIIHYHEGVAGFAHNLIVRVRRFFLEG